MARPRTIDSDLVARAKEVVARTTDLTSLREAQAVLLPAVFNASLEQTASVLGVGRATVHRLQTRFGSKSTKDSSLVRAKWGGRRRALLSPAEETVFLDRWMAKAKKGELVVLSAMHDDLEKQLDREVAPEVFYRLMRRHGWRKVTPDTRHPKSDPQEQDDWKKKRFRSYWQPS